MLFDREARGHFSSVTYTVWPIIVAIGQVVTAFSFRFILLLFLLPASQTRCIAHYTDMLSLLPIAYNNDSTFDGSQSPVH
jgi:hypothetical protein